MGRIVQHPPRRAKKSKPDKAAGRGNVKVISDNNDSVRVSKRNRQQAFPYQSPESIIKISKQFTPAEISTKKSNVASLNGHSKEVEVAKIPPRKNKTKVAKNIGRKSIQTAAKKNAKAKSSAVKKTVKRAPKKPVTKATQKTSPASSTSRKRKLDEKETIISPVKTKKQKTTPAASENLENGIPKTPKKRKDLPPTEAKPKKSKAVSSTTETDASKKGKRRRKEQLNPKPHVTAYDKDPLYESKLEVPPISSLANARLLIRPVLLKDNKLLKSLLSTKNFYCSVSAQRTVEGSGDSAITYALKNGNIEAIKLLMDPKNDELAISAPEVLIQRESTGHNSNRMFGHAMRAVTVGRGGKEGNAAFLKDPSSGQGVPSHSTVAVQALECGVSFETLEKLDTVLNQGMGQCCQNVVLALRTGNRVLAGKLIQWGNQKGGYGFNQLHEEVLLKTTEPLEPFKSVSVLKKAFNTRFTPLHCAAINPNVRYLAELLDANAQVNTEDKDQWTVLHYAAVCEGDGPLDNILSQGGAFSNVINKEGNTPLHLACRFGRLANARRILQHEKQQKESATAAVGAADEGQEDDEDDSGSRRLSIKAMRKTEKAKAKANRFANTSSLIRANKIGLTPLHVAAKHGHVDIVRFLLDSEEDLDINKPIAAAFDKLSPLMLAAIEGHLNVVQFLVSNREKYGVKLELTDKRGRTALTHAVMNGNSHIVSYLLRLGVNHLVADSSGNTLMHYAAAYGWYFNCKLLMEAGCPTDATSNWKITPLAVAFMKGHMGLVNMFLQAPGADINAVVNAANGRNLLLEVCYSRPCASMIEKLKFLVQEQRADVNVMDHEKNTPLHGIVEAYVSHCNWYYRNNKEDNPACQFTPQAAKLLIEAGCNPSSVNENGDSPVSISIKNGIFSLLNNAFRSTVTLPKDSDKDGNNFFHLFVSSSRNPGLMELCNHLVAKPNQLALARELAQQKNKQGLTPLLSLLKSSTGYVPHDELKHVKAFLQFLLDKLQSDVNAVELDKEGKTVTTVLHTAVALQDPFLPAIMSRKPNLDVLNGDGQTPLVQAILNHKGPAAEELIKAGANVNFSSEKYPSILLAYVESKSDSYWLAPVLINKGADVDVTNPKTGDSPLHVIAAHPAASFALESVELILKKGYSPLTVNKNGRTPLHLAVSSRGGEVDVMYDVELALMRAAPKALSVRDVMGRVPLHYVFVKANSSGKFMDPIELMAMVVRDMKDQGHWLGQDFKDIYKSTPLHYAACIGATICVSLLIKEKPHWIDLPDEDSNTPFGLAVFYGAEGCALAMQQNNGKFTIPLNTGREIEHTVTNVASRTSSDQDSKRPLKWSHLQLTEEQENKLRTKEKVVTILEEVVRKDWQGILHLMGESLRNSGSGLAPLIQAAIRNSRLKLAEKLLRPIANPKDLAVAAKDGTLMHDLAKHVSGVPTEIVKQLLAKGVDVTQGDEFNSNALIHASLRRNYDLLTKLLEHVKECGREHVKSRADAFGRTLFSALFWAERPDEKLDSSNVTSRLIESLRGFEREETLTFYPIKLSPLPYVRFLRLKVPTLADCDSDSRLSPLMMSVIAGHYQEVKFLLSLDGKHKLDVNLQDGKGRTAIMHAVRLNDIKMVKLLLMSNNYDPSKDNTQWEPSRLKSIVAGRSQIFSKRLDLNIRDNEGFTVVDHLIRPSKLPFSYAHSDLILQLLAAAKAPINEASLNRAKSLGLKHLVRSIQSVQGKKPESIPIHEEFPELLPLPPKVKVPTPDFAADAKLMAEQIKAKAENKKVNILPDTLIGSDVNQYEVVMENELPYDCVMTKVDVNYGLFGLYNFYKMQLLTHRATGMVLLFTRWGRVGDDGQYQKTPFANLEEGSTEFKKIFKAKSGNVWEDIDKFTPMPKKYRLIKKELRNRRKPNDVKIDFDALKKAGEAIPSKNPKAVEELFRHLCLTHQHRNHISGVNVSELPFGLLTPDALQKGDEILSKIEDLLVKKAKLEENPNHSKDEEQILLEQIVELSEEYYVTIPVYGFSSERLTPIFTKHDLQQKQRVIKQVLHLDFATQVLAAAAYNAEKQNPFDYAYSCLNTTIQWVDPEDMEAQIILQSIENTGGEDWRQPKVYNIFRIHRAGETERINATGIGNRQLLWHGTRDANLLSILAKGLQVAPTEAQINGHLFGKGIYFADMFVKSQGYCYGNPFSYMFLCDVALGKVHPVTFPRHDEKEKKKDPPANFDSVKTADSEYDPCPSGSISVRNRTIHLGKQTRRVLLDNKQSYGLSYNEYVVFNPEQVSIKYMIQIQQ